MSIPQEAPAPIPTTGNITINIHNTLNAKVLVLATEAPKKDGFIKSFFKKAFSLENLSDTAASAVRLVTITAAGFFGYGVDKNINGGRVTTTIIDGIGTGTKAASELYHNFGTEIDGAAKFLENAWKSGEKPTTKVSGMEATPSAAPAIARLDNVIPE